MSHEYLPTNHKRITQLTPAQIERMREARRDGVSVPALAERFGVSRIYVSNLTSDCRPKVAGVGR